MKDIFYIKIYSYVLLSASVGFIEITLPRLRTGITQKQVSKASKGQRKLMRKVSEAGVGWK